MLYIRSLKIIIIIIIKDSKELINAIGSMLVCLSLVCVFRVGSHSMRM